MRHLLILLVCLLLAPPALAEQVGTWQGKTAAQWAGQLADPDSRVRWYAAYSLGRIGPAAAAEATAPLRTVLANRGEDEYVRGNAAWALGRIRSDDKETLQALIEALPSPKHISVRRNAAEALGDLGPAAKPAVPELLKALQGDDGVTRVHAAAALWKIQEDAKALPALVDILRQGPESAACQAAVVLGSLGADAETTAAALGGALRHRSPDVRRAAARSLGQIGRPALAAIKKALDDPDADVRRLAVEALGGMGPGAVRALVVALKNDMPSARRAAARALGQLGVEAKTAEPALVEAVNDPDAGVRDAAAKALRSVRAQ